MFVSRFYFSEKVRWVSLFLFSSYWHLADGADLLDMSMKYNVHVSFSSSPMALTVEGLLGHLDRLSDHITSIKEVNLLTFKFVHPIHPVF
jgi:hypothetical protein